MEFDVGDNVKVYGDDLFPSYGRIEKLCPKTALVRLQDGQTVYAPYNHLGFAVFQDSDPAGDAVKTLKAVRPAMVRIAGDYEWTLEREPEGFKLVARSGDFEAVDSTGSSIHDALANFVPFRLAYAATFGTEY